MFGFFKKYDAHLCSVVSGRILDNGEPLVGVKVERELMYIDEKKRIDSTLTDKNGCFTLPVVNVRSKAPGWAFCEQFTKQFIWINLKSKYHVLWNASLSSVEPISAYDRKLSQLNADLSSEQVAFTFTNKDSPHVPHCARSICRWDTDFEILHIIED
ncbi:DUF6795 domain-containing protein [Colwellia sp. 20A7]|uniref:DUF6795 domain-containing protein n=1 Tax=Colwellia sp. 20A7 TaxID=2689569 RepID=UPI00135CCD9E|nr:DUF6795 domain-containing protein [Colwellia sp. 20A7]